MDYAALGVMLWMNIFSRSWKVLPKSEHFTKEAILEVLTSYFSQLIALTEQIKLIMVMP